jgi:ABC-2 type transport system permease protein
MSRTVTLACRQALLEQRTFWRSAEYALFTFALPLALLLLIGSTTATGNLPGTHIAGQMLFVPSIIAFGVIVAAYVNLGAKLATLRHDGVLKRIRTTPLPASAYLSGVLGSTAATTLAITACIVAIGAIAFGAVPRASGLPEIAGGLFLGVVCFGALGLALSSVARSAESASPIANASYLPLAIMSGIFDPTFAVPHFLSAVVGLFPVRALAHILQQGYTPAGHASLSDLFVLLAWTAAAVGFAVWRFRWH